MLTEPKISCLLVTKRLGTKYIEGAVRSFSAQTYKNKELVVVYSHSLDKTVYEFQNLCSDLPCVMYKVKDSCRLGECRNVSVELASGEFVCQWDDDDISHKDRLKFQIGAMEYKGASILSAQYHEYKGKVFVEQRPTKPEAVHSGWCGTVLAEKKLLLHVYPRWDSKAEDTKGLSLIKDLKVIRYDSPFFHYYYRYTGDNTWEESHHEMMIRENTFGEIDSRVKDWIYNGFGGQVAL